MHACVGGVQLPSLQSPCPGLSDASRRNRTAFTQPHPTPAQFCGAVRCGQPHTSPMLNACVLPHTCPPSCLPPDSAVQ